MTDDLTTRIRDLADELTDPRAHREPYTIWVGGHRKTHYHPTVQHGLLTQLYRAVLPTWSTSDEPSSKVPGSRPPLEVEALSRHDQITAAAASWCMTLGIKPRISPESNIRALVGGLGRIDDQQHQALLADLRRWTGWCRVYLGLEQVRRIPGTRCPLTACAQLGSLRINLTTSHGLCTACGATWDRDTIGILANHIQASRTTVQMGA